MRTRLEQCESQRGIIVETGGAVETRQWVVWPLLGNVGSIGIGAAVEQSRLV